MYITIHSAVGGAIGQFISDPFVAFLIGVVSHFILDIIPHGDEEVTKKVTWLKSARSKLFFVVGSDFTILFFFFIFWTLNSPVDQLLGMFAGIAGGIVPDALWGFHELTDAPFLRWYRKKHSALHNIIKTKLTTKQGFMLQIPLLIILTWVIIMF